MMHNFLPLSLKNFDVLLGPRLKVESPAIFHFFFSFFFFHFSLAYLMTHNARLCSCNWLTFNKYINKPKTLRHSFTVLTFLFVAVPELPPTNISAKSYDPFSVFIQWDGVPRDAINQPKGYQIITYLRRTVHLTNTTNYTQTNIVINNLIPSTLFVFAICPYNTIGIGPCDNVQAITMNSGKYNITSMCYIRTPLPIKDLRVFVWPKNITVDVTSRRI